jgi:hypothetical protein
MPGWLPPPVRRAFLAIFFLKNSLSRSDKLFVGRFLEDAEAILNAAETAATAAPNPANVTILITPEGGIHMLAESDWPLASLEAHHGARTLYRVSQTRGRTTVEGRSGNQRCHLETEQPQAVARRLLAGSMPAIPSI